MLVSVRLVSWENAGKARMSMWHVSRGNLPGGVGLTLCGRRFVLRIATYENLGPSIESARVCKPCAHESKDLLMQRPELRP